jgi:ATP-dependent exoDNAse (exonuclease V) beta subunit
VDPALAVDEACRILSEAEPEADWEAARRESVEVLRGFLGSPAARELAKVEVLGREVPFVSAQDGAVVRGTIDLVYRQGGRVFVADYKSEAVTSSALPHLREKYRRQGEDYRAAVERAWGEKGVEFRLIFLRQPEAAGQKK